MGLRCFWFVFWDLLWLGGVFVERRWEWLERVVGVRGKF